MSKCTYCGVGPACKGPCSECPPDVMEDKRNSEWPHNVINELTAEVKRLKDLLERQQKSWTSEQDDDREEIKILKKRLSVLE